MDDFQQGEHTMGAKPAGRLDRLNGAVNKALEEPEIRRNLEDQGMVQTGGAPQKFGERIQKDYQRWVRVVKEAGIKAE